MALCCPESREMLAQELHRRLTQDCAQLSHCTLPWRGNHERRTIFNKYAPYGMHHQDRAYDTTDIGLSPSQRARVSFPPEWFNEEKDAAVGRRRGLTKRSQNQPPAAKL